MDVFAVASYLRQITALGCQRPLALFLDFYPPLLPPVGYGDVALGGCSFPARAGQRRPSEKKRKRLERRVIMRPDLSQNFSCEPSALITPPEEAEHGTRPGGRGPGVVPGGVGSKNRGGACARIQ